MPQTIRADFPVSPIAIQKHYEFYKSNIFFIIKTIFLGVIPILS